MESNSAWTGMIDFVERAGQVGEGVQEMVSPAAPWPHPASGPVVWPQVAGHAGLPARRAARRMHRRRQPRTPIARCRS